jgi:8-hydroxy-5-deazaflavin:NADPH oxidoreductase
MRIGIIGSSTVAQTLAAKLLELGQSVMVSSRDVSQVKDLGPRGVVPSAAGFAQEQRELGRDAAAGSFADAAAHGEVVVNATAGGHSLEALEAAGAANLGGKVLVDVANALDFSRGMPPTLLFCNTDSLAERIQTAFPETRVVKTLSTVTAKVMVDPGQFAELTTVFVAGNDQAAKDWVRTELLESWFGWRHVLDVGDVTAARGLEMWMPLWLRLMGATGTPLFNLRIVTAG